MHLRVGQELPDAIVIGLVLERRIQGRRNEVSVILGQQNGRRFSQIVGERPELDDSHILLGIAAAAAATTRQLLVVQRIAHRDS